LLADKVILVTTNITKDLLNIAYIMTI
jgi:hypothetical protein